MGSIDARVIIFDMMGVIFEEGIITKNILYPLIKEEGIDMDYSELKGVYNKYSRGEITREEFNESVPKSIEEEFLDEMRLEEGIKKVVGELREMEYVTGILSNIPKYWAYYLSKKFNFPEYFSPRIYSGEHGVKKPDKELFEIFVEEAGTSPGNCCFIDDKLRNLESASKLGMKTIWFRRRDPKSSFDPGDTIEKPSDLTDIFISED